MHFPVLTLALLTTSTIAASPPTVRTTSGLINGINSAWLPDVQTYLGIPYALPPVGPLRFAPPQSLRSNATFQATQFMPSCPGNVRTNGTISYASVKDTMKGILGQAGDVFSEDCLGVNVWTSGQGKGKAVMVWIYGGGFNSGNSNSPAYNGARLAKEQDVVVVSINYRVHIFGFPGASFMEDKNPGFLDQRMGLEWVRDNIEAFGGDPKHITLFGQSAGGISVDMHTYAWKDDPIAAAYISSSGSTTDKSAVSSVNGTGWWSASLKLGCGGSESGEKSVHCMRGKNVDEILAATKSGPRVGAFGPAADGKVVFADYNARRAKGDFVKRPMLVGNTNNEGALYEMLGQPNVFSGSGPGINCLSHATAKARVDSGVKAWRYLYAGEWPNQDIGKTGAFHGSDIGIWFGTTEYLSHKPDTDEEKKLINQIMPAWAAFAKDPENGLVKLGWPTYDASKPTVIRIAGFNSAEISFEARVKFDKYGTPGAEKMC